MPTALVIDDNRQAADSLSQLLTLLDVSAEIAYGPRAAMLTLNESIPGVIFLDIHMPGVDGFEILSYLRRDPRLDRTPVIVVTSDDQLETRKKGSWRWLSRWIEPRRRTILWRKLKKIHR